MLVHCEICGVALSAKRAAACLQIDGRPVYFCCDACRRTFHEHPDLFPLARHAAEFEEAEGIRRVS